MRAGISAAIIAHRRHLALEQFSEARFVSSVSAGLRKLPRRLPRRRPALRRRRRRLRRAQSRRRPSRLRSAPAAFAPRPALASGLAVTVMTLSSMRLSSQAR